MKHIKYFTLVFLTFIALGVLPTDAQQNVAQEAYAILEDSLSGLPRSEWSLYRATRH